MARLLFPEFPLAVRKWSAFILASTFLLGISFGIRLYQRAGASVSSLMCMAVSCRVSIVGLLVPFLLPFLFSAFAVYLHFPLGLLVISFLKAALFGYISCGVLGSFGSAGWMIRLLFLFSDICFTILLYLFWQRHISRERRFSMVEAVTFFAVACAISGVDFFIISPFLRDVLGL